MSRTEYFWDNTNEEKYVKCHKFKTIYKYNNLQIAEKKSNIFSKILDINLNITYTFLSLLLKNGCYLSQYLL